MALKYGLWQELLGKFSLKFVAINLIRSEKYLAQLLVAHMNIIRHSRAVLELNGRLRDSAKFDQGLTVKG